MVTLNKSVILSLCCNLFHYYAFSVYAFSAVILAPLFFHTDNIQLTKILGLITLSITLLLKPLGGIIFGHIGDKYGRKVALIYSLIAITLATTCIGFIPSYATIGWLSSALLMLCLFVQGICMGGQFTGAIIFIQEHTPKHYASFACGLMISIGVLGTLLGTATSFFFYHFKELGWEWRLPFLLTALFGIALSYLMKHMHETPAFMENKSEAKGQKPPLLAVFKNHKKVLCSSVFISSIPVSMFYLATVYIPNFYGDQDGADTIFNSLGLVCLAQAFCILFIPLLGLMGDKIGKEAQLKITSFLLIIVPFFLFYYMNFFNNLYMSVFGVLLLSSFASLYSGPAPAYLSEKFPVIGRYTGMGLSIAIGEGLFGGLSPIVCVGIERLFDSQIAPAYYVIFLGVLSFLGVLLSSKKTIFKKGEDQDFQVKNTPQKRYVQST